MAKVSYDATQDILVIHIGFAQGEAFLSNEIIGDLVLDISTKRRIVGIEVFNASAFLLDFGVARSLLEDLEDAVLDGAVNEGKITVQLTLKSKKTDAHITLPLAIA